MSRFSLAISCMSSSMQIFLQRFGGRSALEFCVFSLRYAARAENMRAAQAVPVGRSNLPSGFLIRRSAAGDRTRAFGANQPIQNAFRGRSWRAPAAHATSQNHSRRRGPIDWTGKTSSLKPVHATANFYSVVLPGDGRPAKLMVLLSNLGNSSTVELRTLTPSI
jgi:hypothetical protein